MSALTTHRTLRAAALALLAALVLHTLTFVAIDRVRAKVLQNPTPATAGVVRTTTADLPEASALRPPFALIARIDDLTQGVATFTIAVDGAPVCQRHVSAAASRRIDCAVGGGWNPTVEHEIEIHGPPTAWTLSYLELATHHGNTDGAHYLVVLPASSDHYTRPALGWVMATWLLLTAALLVLPAPPPLPRWIRVGHRALAGVIALELLLSLFSPWLTDYRIVVSAGTFARFVILLLAPRLLGVARSLAQSVLDDDVKARLKAAGPATLDERRHRGGGWRQRAGDGRAYWPALLVGLVGIVLVVSRWYHSRPLWLDEEMTMLNVRDRTFASLAGSLWFDQTAPLGWLAAQRAAITLFGISDRSVHTVPVVFALATFGAAFWAGRRWMGPAGATVLLLLVSFGSWVAFYFLEVKPYSADFFWALCLAALVRWAAEADAGGRIHDNRRAVVWWTIAAIGLWFANGALFVAPGFGLVLVAVTWRRSGRRAALAALLPATAWLVSFALHYQLALRHALHSDYLRDYWSWALPPSSGGFPSLLSWLARQLEPLAVHPGGTGLWAVFWLVAAAGIVFAFYRRPRLGFILVTPILSALLLAALRVVPLADRVALWIVPALYVSIAIALDSLVLVDLDALANLNWHRFVPAALGTTIVVWLCADIYDRGRAQLDNAPKSNHGLDDGAALQFLLGRRQPGDVFVTTHFGLPAVWWYGGISVAPPNLGSYERDGAPIFELRYEQPGSECRQNELRTRLAGQNRVGLYLGFDSRNPDGFQELTLDGLSELGTMTDYRAVAEEGRVAIFDLRLPPKPWTAAITQLSENRGQVVARPPGCVRVRPAARW